MQKLLTSVMCLSLAAGCGGGANNAVTATPSAVKTTPAPVDTSPFLMITNDTSCADLQNRLFVIDQQYVLSEKRGTCSDAQYRQTLYGKTPDTVICTNADSIAGPRFSCSDPTVSALFKRAIENLGVPDLGLGLDHTVQAVSFASNSEAILPFSSFAAPLFYNKAPTNIVLKDEKLWTQFVAYGQFKSPLKWNLDFNSQMVLGSFFKSANNCSRTQIQKVSSNGQKVIAQFQEKNIVAISSCDPNSSTASTPMNLVSTQRLDLPVEFVDVSAMALASEVIGQENISGVQTARNAVIKDQAQWQILWAEHSAGARPLPIIDFSKKMVIAVFAGSKPNGCYGISEVAIWRYNNRINVSTHETTSPPGVMCTMYLPSPAYFVTVDKSNDSVDFTTIPVIY